MKKDFRATVVHLGPTNVVVEWSFKELDVVYHGRKKRTELVTRKRFVDYFPRPE